MAVAQRNLEIAYFNTGYYDTRIPELRERLRARPEDRDARWELGRTLALLGQHDEAAERVPGAARATTRATSRRCSSWRWRKSNRATSSTRKRALERALDARSEQLAALRHARRGPSIIAG